MLLERVWAVDTITGVRQGLVPVKSFSWDRKINEAGKCTASLNVVAAANMGVSVRSLLKVHRTTLVYEVDAFVVAAGVITELDYDWSTRELSVTMGDLWDIFEKRLVLNRPDTSTMEIPYSKLDATILSLQGLAKWYIDGSLNLPPGWDEYKLPLTLPTSVTGPVVARTIYGYELRTLADALRDLQAMSGGPDMVLLPRWAGGGGTAGPLLWDFRMADTWTYPQTVGYNLGAHKSGVKQLRYRLNGDRVATRALAVGEGSERRLRLGNAFTTDTTYPALEVVEASKNEKLVGRLNALAQETVRTRDSPTQQWDMVVSKRDTEDGALPSWQLQLGAGVRINNLNDPWLPYGFTEHRVVQLSGDLASDDLTITFQEV